jgi:hypothetical protein
MNTSRGSMRTLVIGRSPEVNRSVVGPLLDAGIDAQGSTQPEKASRRFNARQFDLIAIGRGVPGPLRDRLKREFTAQNPSIWLADVFAPIAVEQILAALAQRSAAAEVQQNCRSRPLPGQGHDRGRSAQTQLAAAGPRPDQLRDSANHDAAQRRQRQEKPMPR